MWRRLWSLCQVLGIPNPGRVVQKAVFCLAFWEFLILPENLSFEVLLSQATSTPHSFSHFVPKSCDEKHLRKGRPCSALPFNLLAFSNEGQLQEGFYHFLGLVATHYFHNLGSSNVGRICVLGTTHDNLWQRTELYSRSLETSHALLEITGKILSLTTSFYSKCKDRNWNTDALGHL